MKRLKRGISDIEEWLKKYDGTERKIKTDDYQRLAESIECTSLYLFNLFADETKIAASYSQFRKILSKKVNQGETEFLLDELGDEYKKILVELRNHRNWSHHVPQSLLNSQINFMINERGGIPKELVEVQFSSREIVVLTWEYHDLGHLLELLINSKGNYQSMMKLFQRVKKDYTKLIGCSMKMEREIQDNPRPSKFREIQRESFDTNLKKRN